MIADSGGGNPSSSIPTSVVGLMIVTVPATITALALLVSKLPRRNRPQDTPPAPLPAPVSPLNSNDPTGARASKDGKRVVVLENFCWRNRIDPTKIKRGDERLEDVRIADE